MNEAARATRVIRKRGPRQADPHELGYRFYRGYIWRRRNPLPDAGVSLYNPAGQFICLLGIREVPRYVDQSIKFGWEDIPTRREPCHQLRLI